MNVVIKSLKKWNRERVNGWYSKYTHRYETSSAGDRPRDPSRVFLSFEGETIIDDLNNRVSRPYTIIKPLLIEKLKAEGIPFEKLRWSQKAGCRDCPCSPGFILEGNYGKDFTLTVIDDQVYPDRGLHIIG